MKLVQFQVLVLLLHSLSTAGAAPLQPSARLGQVLSARTDQTELGVGANPRKLRDRLTLKSLAARSGTITVRITLEPRKGLMDFRACH